MSTKVHASSELISDADAVRRGVASVARRMRRVRADHGVSAAKLSVLGQLYRADCEMTAVNLARLENLQPQSLTRIIAELEALGLLARRQDDEDRRQVLIHITLEGRALLINDARRQTAWLGRAMASRLTETERGLLSLAARLLERLGEAEE